MTEVPQTKKTQEDLQWEMQTIEDARRDARAVAAAAAQSSPRRPTFEGGSAINFRGQHYRIQR
jgi:hypothetical protein